MVLCLGHECNSAFVDAIDKRDLATQSQVSFGKEAIIGLIIWILCMLYSTIRTASSSSRSIGSHHVLKDEGGGKEKQQRILNNLIFIFLMFNLT